MNFFFLKRIIVGLIILTLLGVGVFIFLFSQESEIIPSLTIPQATSTYEVIGNSVAGRKIEAYTFLPAEMSEETKHLLFVGGIHGGYEWNSVALAYQFIDYLKVNLSSLPADIMVTVIPVANPDGLYLVTGKEGRFTEADLKTDLPVGTGRFNAHQVDLNRNFACNWQATSTWRTTVTSGGTSAFSEPEAKALRDYIFKNNISAGIFWHSQSNAVYASQCNNGILPQTLDIMNVYAKAAGYPAVNTFDSYAVTGAVEDWLASINIPAITVELKTHENVEWDKNLAGIKAVINYFSSNSLKGQL